MLTAGTIVAGYRVKGLVGEGGMATVYEAHQISLDRVVAFKVLSQRLGHDPSFRERFRRECNMQARLDHPNIVPIYAAEESEYGLWLAMRLVRGPTLRELLVRERLSPEVTLGLLTPIAAALDVAHEHDLVHRDITPQNILVDERGHPYLSDFGITKGRGDRSLTRTGQFVGTLDYVAPEQIRDEPSDAPTDTYALAAILFECLTGRVPFDKQSEAAVLYAHIAEDPPRASEIEVALPLAIDEVLEKGLAKQPGDRYGSASELVEAAASALRGEVHQAAETPLPTVPEESRRRASPRSLAIVLGALLLALAALGIGAIGAGNGSGGDARRVAAGDLAVSLPSGWAPTKKEDSSLPLADPVVLTPEARAEGESVVVGMSAAVGESLLPKGFRSVSGVAQGTPVSLGALEALRYPRVRPPGSSRALVLFVSPTTQGVATVACRPAQLGTDFSDLCQRLAASLELTRGELFPLGPSAELTVALRRQLGRLSARRTVLRRRLGAAGSAESQASAALGLADAFRSAARGLSRHRVTPQSAAALAALVSSLRVARDGYKNLATAARQEDTARYRAATHGVSAAEARVDRRLLDLRSLGYRVGSSQ